jgi:hypothetical protein
MVKSPKAPGGHVEALPAPVRRTCHLRNTSDRARNAAPQGEGTCRPKAWSFVGAHDVVALATPSSQRRQSRNHPSGAVRLCARPHRSRFQGHHTAPFGAAPMVKSPKPPDGHVETVPASARRTCRLRNISNRARNATPVRRGSTRRSELLPVGQLDPVRGSADHNSPPKSKIHPSTYRPSARLTGKS